MRLRVEFLLKFCVVVTAAVVQFGLFSHVAWAQEEDMDGSSVTLEDNPFIGDETPPTVIQHHSTAPKMAAPPEPTITVRTLRFVSTKKVPPAKNIQLLGPAHNSKFGPGVIGFAWKAHLPKAKRKNIVNFVLEKMDADKKAVQPTTLEKINVDLRPGSYRWQVVSEKYHIASRWRYFRVLNNPLGLKSGSLTKLYDGPSPGVPKIAARSHSHAARAAARPQKQARRSKHEAPAARTARRVRPVQPAPASIGDTDESSLAAGDYGMPGSGPKAKPQPRRTTRVQPPPPRERAAAEKPESRAPALPPRPQPVRAAVKPLPANPRVPSSAPVDERQKEIDSLKFDE